MSRKVAVKTDDGVSVHCECTYGDYDTLCGIDSNDDSIGHFGTVPLPPNAKIDCAACRNIWETARRYRKSDFK